MTDYKMLGKYGLWGVGTLVAGVGGYFAFKYVQKKMYEKKLEDLAVAIESDENDDSSITINGVEYTGEPKDLVNYVVEKVTDDNVKKEEKEVELDETSLAGDWEPKLSEKKNRKVKKDTTEKPKIVDYAALSRKLTKPPLEEVAKEHLGEETVEETEQDPDDAHIISFDDFVAGQQKGFEKMVLTLYEKDDVLCDPNNEVVHTPEELLGPDGLLNFGENSGDPDVVYIRNPLTSTDYEVVRLRNKSYQVEVLGVKPDRNRRQVRKVTKMNDEDSNE